MADSEFDPTQFGAVAVEEPPFDPTQHGAIPVEQPKPQGGVLSGVASAIGSALNPINIVKGALDIGQPSDISNIMRYGKTLGEIVTGTKPDVAIGQNIPELQQQREAVYGKLGGREQAAALTGIGLQLGLTALPFIHGKTLPRAPRSLAEVAEPLIGKAPETVPVEAEVAAQEPVAPQGATQPVAAEPIEQPVPAARQPYPNAVADVVRAHSEAINSEGGVVYSAGGKDWIGDAGSFGMGGDTVLLQDGSHLGHELIDAVKTPSGKVLWEKAQPVQEAVTPPTAAPQDVLGKQEPVVQTPTTGRGEGVRQRMTVDEARKVYDQSVAESKMTEEQMASERGMSQAYQEANPYAAYYALKRAKETAEIPFDEHLQKLRNNDRLQETPPTPTGEPNAVQEPSTGEILQRQPEEIGTTGSERVGVEQGVQGEIPAETLQAAAPQAEVAAPTIKNLVDRYDAGDEKIQTVRDLVDEVDARHGDNPEVAAAVEKYRADQEENMQEFGGRGDEDQIESDFLNAIQEVAAPQDLGGSGATPVKIAAGTGEVVSPFPKSTVKNVVYHAGVNDKSSGFSRIKETGTYFSDAPRNKAFGRYATESHIDVKNPFYGAEDQYRDIQLDWKAPKITEDFTEWATDNHIENPTKPSFDDYVEYLNDRASNPYEDTSIVQAIKKAGYDGIIGNDTHGGTKEYVVFDPKQIKVIKSYDTSKSNVGGTVATRTTVEAPPPKLGTLANRYTKLGGTEGRIVEDLFDRTNPDREAAIAQEHDLNTVTKLQADKAAQEVKDFTQWHLRNVRKLPDVVTVYRAGPLTHDVVGVTLDRNVAVRRGARQGDPVIAYQVPRSAILADIEALRPEAFAEKELLVHPEDLKPYETTQAETKLGETSTLLGSDIAAKQAIQTQPDIARGVRGGGAQETTPSVPSAVESTTVKTSPEIPVEPPTPPVTSLKNAVTAVERDTRGLSPREEVQRRSWDEAKAIAGKQAASDPNIGARLVDELNKKPRALDDVEGAHLLRRKAEVNAEHDAAIKQMNSNPEDVNAIARLKSARDELQKTYNAAEVSGTAWGRGGKIRQALMAEDFSPQAMEAKARAIGNKGKPLADNQLRNVADQHAEIAKQEASIRLSENDLQRPTGRMSPKEIIAEIETMKQRLTPCL